MIFTPIGHNLSLTQQVERELTQAIRTGNYLPGSKLPTENELCKMFNVSRTAIREAVKKMSAKGLVHVKQGSGVYVQEVSIKNASEVLNMFFELSSNEDVISQTIDARLHLEPVLAAQAANIRTDQHLELLQHNMDSMRRCDLCDKEREAELDNDFHRTILSISNNSVLTLLLSPIFNLMPKFKAIVYAKPINGNIEKDKEIMLAHHDYILQAIIQRNEKEAMQAMQRHIMETKNNYTKSKIGS